MNKIWTALAAFLVLLLLVALGYAAYRLLHHSPPTLKLISDASKPWKYNHIDEDLSIYNAGLHVAVDGEINGNAEFYLESFKYELHAGHVHFEINEPEWWCSTVDLAYKPTNVTSGNLQVVVNIQ